MKVEIKNGELVVTLPLNPQPVPSKSGKTLLVATSNGLIPTTAQVNGKPVTVGVNAFIPRN